MCVCVALQASHRRQRHWLEGPPSKKAPWLRDYTVKRLHRRQRAVVDSLRDFTRGPCRRKSVRPRPCGQSPPPEARALRLQAWTPSWPTPSKTCRRLAVSGFFVRTRRVWRRSVRRLIRPRLQRLRRRREVRAQVLSVCVVLGTFGLCLRFFGTFTSSGSGRAHFLRIEAGSRGHTAIGRWSKLFLALARSATSRSCRPSLRRTAARLLHVCGSCFLLFNCVCV